MNEVATINETSKLGAILLAAMLCLSLLALPACSARDFAGTWVGQSAYTDSLGFKYDIPIELTITKDGSCSMNVQRNGRITGMTWNSANMTGTCEVAGTNVNLYLNGLEGGLHMNFAMSSNGKQTLTMDSGAFGAVELTRISTTS